MIIRSITEMLIIDTKQIQPAAALPLDYGMKLTSSHYCLTRRCILCDALAQQFMSISHITHCATDKIQEYKSITEYE